MKTAALGGITVTELRHKAWDKKLREDYLAQCYLTPSVKYTFEKESAFKRIISWFRGLRIFHLRVVDIRNWRNTEDYDDWC